MPGNKENLFDAMGAADPNMILNVNVPETVRKQAREWRRGTRKGLYHPGREKIVRSCHCFRERCKSLFPSHDKSSLSMQSVFDQCRREFESPYPGSPSICNGKAVNRVAKMTSGLTNSGGQQQLQQVDYRQVHPQRQGPDPQNAEAHERKEHSVHNVHPNQFTPLENVQGTFSPKHSRTCLRRYRHQQAPPSCFLKSSLERPEVENQPDKTVHGQNTSSVSALCANRDTHKVTNQTEELGRRGYLSSTESGNSSRSEAVRNFCTSSKKNCFPLSSHQLPFQEACCVECLRYGNSSNSGLSTSYPVSHPVTNPQPFTKVCEGKASFQQQRRCQLPVDTSPYSGPSRCLGISANEDVRTHLIGLNPASRKYSVADSTLVGSGVFDADGGLDSRRDDLQATCCYQARSPIMDGTVDDITALSVAETVDFFLNMTSPLSGSESEDSMDLSHVQAVWNLQEDTFL